MSCRLVFFGSSDYSVPVLQKLVDQKIIMAGVVTTRDKPVGRHLELTPNPVKLLAQKYQLPVYEKFSSLTTDLPGSDLCALVAAFGRIIPPDIMSIFNGRIYNIHPSLLPKYRGPSPLQQQILDGVVDTGVTLIRLDNEMDHGPVVAVIKDIVSAGDTPRSLGTRLFTKGADLFIKLFLDGSLSDSSVFQPQDDSLATYTKKISRQDGFLPYPEFSRLLKKPDSSLIIKFRAYYPWPGVWTSNPEGKRIKLVSINPLLVLKEGGKPEKIIV